MTFKEYLREVVSPDCADGAGVVPNGPYKGWKLIRTSHLDSKRPPSERDRDHGFVCLDFNKIVTKLTQKRPFGLKDGKTQIVWQNEKGYQSAVVAVDNNKKTITFVTIIQLNKKTATKYETKGMSSINLGIIKSPN